MEGVVPLGMEVFLVVPLGDEIPVQMKVQCDLRATYGHLYTDGGMVESIGVLWEVLC